MYKYMYIHMSVFYDVVESKRRYWFAVTLTFTPCDDRQTDFYYKKFYYKSLSDDRHKA